MSESFIETAFGSIRKRGIELPQGAVRCTGIHALVAKAIWPRKTAECWAAAAKRKARMAKYWLAGGKVSDAGRMAIVRELTGPDDN